MSADNSYLSFPPGAISPEPLRLSLLWNSEFGIALNKPAGLPAFQDTRLGGGSGSILVELNNRAAAGATQLKRLEISSLLAVNLLDRDASGLLLLAKTPEARAQLKNAMGSSQFTFRYRFLSVAACDADKVSCDLPVAVHRQKPMALISNRTGKKAQTTFRRLETFKECSLWESESEYDRFHQVRLHAAEVGVPILNDPFYQTSGRGAGRKTVETGKGPLAGADFFLHLSSVHFPAGEESLDLKASYPRRLRMFLQKLAG